MQCPEDIRSALLGLEGVNTVEFVLRDRVFHVRLGKRVPEDAVRRAVESAGSFKVASVSTVNGS